MWWPFPVFSCSAGPDHKTIQCAGRANRVTNRVGAQHDTPSYISGHTRQKYLKLVVHGNSGCLGFISGIYDSQYVLYNC